LRDDHQPAFGDNQTITGTCGDLSPLHFTGKERDSTFGAGLLASTVKMAASPPRLFR
jgi:hypothetical protein